MKEEINDGCPAFPFSFKNEVGQTVLQQGMSLRDWYAGMALQGLICCSQTTGSYVEFAEESFKYADAMIAERIK
jgi:hypothetical protein